MAGAKKVPLTTSNNSNIPPPDSTAITAGATGREEWISRKTSNSRISRGLLTESSSIFLSHSFCTKSLMNENTANSFIRDSGSRKESNSEGVILQVVMRFAGIFYISITGQPDYPREQAVLGVCSISTQIVRNRMKSVRNIQKITKAMKMVAASKLRAIQTRAENSRGLWQPFTALLGDTPSFCSSYSNAELVYIIDCLVNDNYLLNMSVLE
ncbi:hypothetical protein BUALT_Bualt09G0058700 [Buddleja alternifolia]|uniref:Uncharacterized protein n=1 Tax=Buddleja alternifolia TaxID=168488 RepID=A0AAV6X6Z6_9LAMI|nr:hypothetical protein BUALT_Bualt09G0058700 [Buddleja alternifolia]